MQENYESVQRGFRILVGSMSSYIGQTLNRLYKDKWWDMVRYALNDQRDLPYDGEYAQLVDSLDIANCIRIITRMWKDDFSAFLPRNCQTWANELMGVRNTVAHAGQQDLDQPMAERALDTMVLLCSEIDKDGAKEIKKLYKEVRSRANDSVRPTMIFRGIEQPESDSKRGALKEGSLLSMTRTDVVKKTTLTRKVTYGGKTVIYPVYRIRLDALYYNDQNDRISTWISQYEAENGKDSLSNLNTDIYNRIIENFITDSNPDAIQKTQKNIKLVGQREPGVTLADGRIVDGNRRFTCLRRIQREQPDPVYFETVIMDMDIQADKKQIKLLELAIQHGEEKKVDYDLIDYAIGTYRDVVQTKLLTAGEYASSTNEPLSEVKKRIEIAEVICEFLEYIKLPEQYHVAREYQVYSVFQEMNPLLKQMNDTDKKTLKRIAFNNALMKAIPDQRRFIRDIRSLIKNGTYQNYFEEQQKLDGSIHEKFDSISIRAKEDIDRFAEENTDIADSMSMSMEKALQKYRSQKLKEKPSENVSKCVGLMMEVDTRLFDRMQPDDREKLKTDLDELIRICEAFQKML